MLRELPLKTNLLPDTEADMPFTVYTVGVEHQGAMTRVQGFSAKQLLVCFSGRGAFRLLTQHQWTDIEPLTLLYIPAEVPHEYVPQGDEPWIVGFISLLENKSRGLESWGYADYPRFMPLSDTDVLYDILERIWTSSGAQFDVWQAMQEGLNFLLACKKQTSLLQAKVVASLKPDQFRIYRESAVHRATRFLHDYTERPLTLTELAAHVGYSPKHLNRLFRQALGMTTMQYMQHIRLQTAALLLKEQPDMTIRQVAAHVGMQPAYLSRMFKRKFGIRPKAENSVE